MFDWYSLPRPIVGLSAMDGVTDASMRAITASVGHPDFCVTEFTSADGIVYGVRKLLRDFHYTTAMRPVIAQLFGADPATFRTAATICCYLGFDGIDINMGCPADSIAKKGGGASLIRNPTLAKAIIRETKAGVDDWVDGVDIDALGLKPEFVALLKSARERQSIDSHALRFRLPVSVKTRIGYEQPSAVEWVKHLLEEEPVVITLHGRTLTQQYSGRADWEEITKASVYVHSQTQRTLLFGNGDLTTPEEIVERTRYSNVDGVWIGRAAMGNPWIFSQYRSYLDTGSYTQPTTAERCRVALDHARLFESMNTDVFRLDPYPFLNMRKHLGWYVKGFPNASELRARLFQAENADEVEKLLTPYL